MIRNDLVIQQLENDLLVKTWRVSAREPYATIGQSKHCDLIVFGFSGIQLVVDFDDEIGWHVSDMQGETFEAEGKSLDHLVLKSGAEIQLKGQTLKFFISNDTALFSTSWSKETSSDTHLITIKSADIVVESFSYPADKPYEFEMLAENQSLSSDQTSLKVGNFEILRQPIAKFKAENSKGPSPNLLKSSSIVAVVTLSLFLLSTIATREPDSAPVAPLSVRIAQPKPFVKPPKKAVAKSSANTKKAGKVSPQKNQASKASASAKSGQNTLKRFSNILGKVAKRVAANANAVRKAGKTADNKLTGTSLASVGSAFEQGGKIGNMLAGNKFNGVATGGKGGGKNDLSGFGGFSTTGVTGAGIGVLDEETEIVGGLDREVIANYIKTQLGQILYCYERQLSANPDLFGKVQIKFEIQADGSVLQQKVKETTLSNRKVENCILTKIAGWNFPKPKGGTRVVVTYPFLFKSTN